MTNVLLIVTDDQETGSIDAQSMPYLHSRPHGHWVDFPKAVQAHPLCYPARSNMLTGLRSDHHGRELNNSGTSGNRPEFNENTCIQRWLADAGVACGFSGKPLNVYPWNMGNHIPSGWTGWLATGAADADDNYFGWTAVDDANQTVVFGTDPEDYATDVFAEYARAWIAGRADPWFCCYWPTAPHAIQEAAPRHAAASITLSDPPTFNPDDPAMAGKPAWLTAMPALTAPQEAATRLKRAEARRCLLAVDEGLELLIDQIIANDQLDDTIIVYCTDNGAGYGRWRRDLSDGNTIFKNTPYENCVDASLMIRHPAAADHTSTALVSTIDLPASIVAWFGAEAESPTLDGLDLTDVLLGAAGRRLAEAKAGGQYDVPLWWSVRNDPGRQLKLIRWDTDETELYDLDIDPHELTNLAATDPDLVDQLDARLDALIADPHAHYPTVPAVVSYSTQTATYTADVG